MRAWHGLRGGGLDTGSAVAALAAHIVDSGDRGLGSGDVDAWLAVLLDSGLPEDHGYAERDID